jgi:putative transposase
MTERDAKHTDSAATTPAEDSGQGRILPSVAPLVNAVLDDRTLDSGPVFHRVLLAAAEWFVIFNCCDPEGMPVWVKRKEIILRIEAGDFAVEACDPFAASIPTYEELSVAQKSAVERQWRAIGPLVTDPQSKIFSESGRTKLLSEAAKLVGTNRWRVYVWLKTYWRYGCEKNALAIGIAKRGGKGKRRAAGLKKRGRPRKNSKTGDAPVGMNLDDAARANIARVVTLHMKGSARFRAVYNNILIPRFYSNKTVLDDGTVDYEPYDENHRVSYDQFYVEAKKILSPGARLARRFGENWVTLNVRPKLGTSEGVALYPGHVYMIDATIGDIYLLSVLNAGRLIGRPVIYLVVDVWSRLIVGFYIGLAGPSWEGARIALRVAFTSKVALCKRYGIDVSDEDFPYGVCGGLMPDRGPEMTGKLIELGGDELKYAISNVTARRPDWKGIVERKFRTLDDDYIDWQPGAVPQVRNRSGPDFRLEATFTLRTFTRFMIRCIMHHNLDKPIDVRPDGFSWEHGAPPRPIELWHWGIQNIGGPRQVSEHLVRSCLLPRAEVHESEHGYRLKLPKRQNQLDLYYKSKEALLEGRFEVGRRHKWHSYPAGYDPWDIEHVEVIVGGRRERAELTDYSRRLFAEQSASGHTFDEVSDYQALKVIGKRQQESEVLRANANLHAELEEIREEAVKERQTLLSASGGRVDARGIRSVRKTERDTVPPMSGLAIAVPDAAESAFPSAGEAKPTTESESVAHSGEAVEEGRKQVKGVDGQNKRHAYRRSPSLVDEIRKARDQHFNDPSAAAGGAEWDKAEDGDNE